METVIINIIFVYFVASALILLTIRDTYAIIRKYKEENRKVIKFRQYHRIEYLRKKRQEREKRNGK